MNLEPVTNEHISRFAARMTAKAQLMNEVVAGCFNGIELRARPDSAAAELEAEFFRADRARRDADGWIERRVERMQTAELNMKVGARVRREGVITSIREPDPQSCECGGLGCEACIKTVGVRWGQYEYEYHAPSDLTVLTE